MTGVGDSLTHLRDFTTRMNTVFLKRLHLLRASSSLIFIFLLNQLIFPNLRPLFEDNTVLGHGALEEVKDENGSRQDALSHVHIVTSVDDLPTIKPLDCLRTKPVLGVSPLICIKPEQEDMFISSSILHEGIWEEDIVTNVLKVARLYKVMLLPIS